jgi:hypothetical protein
MRSALAAEAPTEEGAGAETPDTVAIQVVGIKHPESVDYAMFLKGEEAFVAHHALAPGATLRFSARASKLMPGSELKLSVVDEEESVALALDQEGSFALPVPPPVKVGEARIVANQSKGAVRIDPLVRSPGLSENQRRFGDLRLECEVIWAMQKDSVPFLARAAFGLVGGACHSAKIAIQIPVRRKLAAAALVQGDKRQAIPLAKEGYAYIPPLYDRAWSNDARVELAFAPRQ